MGVHMRNLRTGEVHTDSNTAPSGYHNDAQEMHRGAAAQREQKEEWVRQEAEQKGTGDYIPATLIKLGLGPITAARANALLDSGEIADAPGVQQHWVTPGQLEAEQNC